MTSSWTYFNLLLIFHDLFYEKCSEGVRSVRVVVFSSSSFSYSNYSSQML